MRLLTLVKPAERSVRPATVFQSALGRSPAMTMAAGRYGSHRRRRLEAGWRALERSSRSGADATTVFEETVACIWKIIEHAASEHGLDVARHGIRAVLARRQLVRRATAALAVVIRRGVASGAFRPTCASWAIRRLPFAIVAGACVHWVFGLATRPSLRASTAVDAAFELLRPRGRSGVAAVRAGEAAGATGLGR
jgi:hypothetical protein